MSKQWWDSGAKDPDGRARDKKYEEAARRLRSQRRKMQAEDRERDRLLGTVRAQRDNDFLQRECGIAPVEFDEQGRIVPWKGLHCEDTRR